MVIFMFFLGIDIGKNTHVASLLDEKATIIFKAYSFANTLDAAEALLVKLEPYKDSLEIEGYRALLAFSLLFSC